jgi:Protein of unknown function (DUF3151)
MTNLQDLMAQPPATQLPDDPEPRIELERGDDPSDVAARHPQSALAWAVLAERAIAQHDDSSTHTHVIAAYAFARTGYHRSLDALRRSGWKGTGPVPWEHEPNRGFLRCLAVLARAAEAINEADEAQRCRQFLRDSSPTAYEVLEPGR